MARNRGGWSKDSLRYVDRVNDILADLREYWPLTLRQVYYQLVAAGDIQNNLGQYNKLSRLLTKARLDGKVSWDSIEDRARATLVNYGWDDSGEYVEAVLRNLFSRYKRNLCQGQKVALEVWVEKDALSRICERAADQYCVPVVVARGFSSISYVHECRKRIVQNTRSNQKTLILYFGDLDPSGWEMLPAMMETLQSEMNLGSYVKGIRCALTREQVDEYALPKNPDALKPTDPRAKKYMRMFGDLAVELDALPPATLEELVRTSLTRQLDLKKVTLQHRQADLDRDKLDDLKEKIRHFVNEAG